MPVGWTAIALLAPSLAARVHAAPVTAQRPPSSPPFAGSDTLNHGTPPPDVFATLQKALDTVDTAGTVHVAPGRYFPNFTIVAQPVPRRVERRLHITMERPMLTRGYPSDGLVNLPSCP